MNLLQKLTTMATVTTIATLTSGTAQAMMALKTSDFSGGQISFANNQTVYFDFFESYNMAKSNLELYNITDLQTPVATLFSEGNLGYDGTGYKDSTDWKGTPYDTVAAPKTSFDFLAGETYVFRLVGDVVPEAGWSSNAGWDLNPNDTDPYSDDQILGGAAAGQDHLKVIDGPGSYTYNIMGPTNIANRQNPSHALYDPNFEIPTNTVEIEDGVVFLAWEDDRYGDGDFNDFMFKAYIDGGEGGGNDTSVPEPSTAGALLGVGVLGLFNLRRRKSRKNG